VTLGEKITVLRNHCKMSQGDLAEKLNVSRQSISKWETNTSVPELDKLIQLSELFHITLDELVKGNVSVQHEANKEIEPDRKAPPPPIQVTVRKSSDTQKVIGVILLCFGTAVLLLLTLLGGLFSGLLFSSPFILCGIVCLLFRQNVGLWCAWALLFAVNVYLRYATGITWRLVRLTLNYKPSMNYMRLAFAWIELICYVTIVAVTVMRFRKKPLPLTKASCVFLVIMCVASATYIPIAMYTLGLFTATGRIYFIFLDWVILVLLTIILTTAARLIHTRKEMR